MSKQAPVLTTWFKAEQIKVATQAAILSLMLSTGMAINSAMAESVDSGVVVSELQVNGSVLNNPEYQMLLSQVDVEFTRFLEMGKSEVSSTDMNDYLETM